jgi:phosphoribosylglycinamide formyltransferase-1
MAEQFISAAIQPVEGTFDAARMSTGGPGLPRQFRWKRQTIEIVRVLRTWRETGPCHHGSGESYVRKHWFEVGTDSGDTLQIYFERQARSGKNRSRWWLFSSDGAENKG